MDCFKEDPRDRMKRAMNEIREICKEGDVVCNHGTCPMWHYCGAPNIEPRMWSKEDV